MKPIILLLLATAPFWAAGQGAHKKPLPEFTYVTPQMTKLQLDSVVALLKQHDLTLSFDTLAFDEHKRIKQASGSLDTRDRYFPFTTDNFKGMTIISRGDSITFIMGILPQKKK